MRLEYNKTLIFNVPLDHALTNKDNQNALKLSNRVVRKNFCYRNCRTVLKSVHQKKNLNREIGNILNIWKARKYNGHFNCSLDSRNAWDFFLGINTRPTSVRKKRRKTSLPYMSLTIECYHFVHNDNRNHMRSAIAIDIKSTFLQCRIYFVWHLKKDPGSPWLRVSQILVDKINP